MSASHRCLKRIVVACALRKLLYRVIEPGSELSASELTALDTWTRLALWPFQLFPQSGEVLAFETRQKPREQRRQPGRSPAVKIFTLQKCHLDLRAQSVPPRQSRIPKSLGVHTMQRVSRSWYKVLGDSANTHSRLSMWRLNLIPDSAIIARVLL